MYLKEFGLTLIKKSLLTIFKKIQCHYILNKITLKII